MAATQAPDSLPSARIPPATQPSTKRGEHEINMMQALRVRAITLLLRPNVLRPVSAIARRGFPILPLGKWTIVTRYLDVVEVLRRKDEFLASPLYAPRIDALDGPFVLGLDPGPQYERELALLHSVVLAGDLERIARIVADEAALQIHGATVRHRAGPRRLDVVPYARAVASRVVAEYFGVPGPLDALAGWLHDIFHDIFSNITNDTSVHARALASTAALGYHIQCEIATRRAGGSDRCKDDVLGRLLSLQGAERPWLDDSTIRRNVSGMIVGTIDNTCTLFTLALAQLLRRPKDAGYARAAALAADVDTVRGYMYEAARFDPPMPLLVRYARDNTTLAAGTRRERPVRAGTALLLGNISALHDRDGFDEPGSFDIDHDAARLLFGYGLHRCLGSAINGVQIPELAAALLRLPGLRPAAGTAGRIQFDGPFPSRLVVEWT